MESYLMMAITLALAILVGHGFMKARIPGGLLVGVMLVFATMQVLTGTLWAPPGTKEIAQMIAGSFIGASLSTADLKRLPRLWKEDQCLRQVPSGRGCRSVWPACSGPATHRSCRG